VEDLQNTRRIAGELRAHAKKVDVVPERVYVVPAKTTVDWEFYGPCIACAKDMLYELSCMQFASWRDRKAELEDWLLKQFEASRRKIHLLHLAGKRQQGLIQIDRLEGIVCPDCRATLAATRARSIAAKEERQNRKEQERQQNEKQQTERSWQERERWQYHTTWREARPQEFQCLRDGIARFTATVSERRPYKILFRWRATGGRCRGDSPRNIVGMWVDRKFVTHYYGWNFKPLKGERPYFPQDAEWDDGYEEVWPPREDSAKQDVFGVGFCRWFERAFQKELLQAKPATSWRTKGGDWPIDVETLQVFNTPCIAHTQWIDGSMYARVIADNELPKVIKFAGQHLGMGIERVTPD
jgi:hypothetical protein